MRIFYGILSLCILLSSAYACTSKGRGEDNTMDRDEELRHYFGGAAEVNTDSIGQIVCDGSSVEYKVTIDVRNLSLIDAGCVLSLCRVIPLQTTSENLIGSIDKLLYADSIFIVLDRELGKRVYTFDYDGNFIATIGYAGRGPEEYIEPTDVFYNHRTQRITVWDQFSHRFLEYDKSGRFIASRAVPIRFLRCAYDKVAGGVWCSSLMENNGLSAIDEYNALLLDSSYTKVVNRFDYQPYLLNYVSRGSNMRMVGDTLFYHPLLSDTIYRIGADSKASPAFSLNFRNIANLPSNVMQQCKGNYEEFYNTYYRTEYAFCESEFFVTDSYLYANINAKRDRFTLRYKRGDNCIDVILPMVAKEGFDLGYMQCANLIWQRMSAMCYAEGMIMASLTLSELNILPGEERASLRVNSLADDANPIVLVFREI